MNLHLSEILLLIANTVACGLCCWYSLTGLNACTRKTALGARLSFAVLAIGSFAALLSPPDFDANGISTTLIASGVGIGFLANRRTCVCLNCPMRPGPRKPTPITWAELDRSGRRATERNEHPGARA
jgi:hypothetical protein